MNFNLTRVNKIYLILIFSFLCTQDVISQRIIPTNYRWTNTIGGFGSVNYGTGHQFSASPNNVGNESKLGYGGGIKLEYQTTYKTRFEFAIGFHQRNYVQTESQFAGLFAVNEVNTSFLSFYTKYKLLMHTAFFSLYAAPGVSLDIELNHPLLNQNASGIGALFSLGFEKRIAKKWIFFTEAEARVQSLLHFKNEEFPYRHVGLQINTGFSVIL